MDLLCYAWESDPPCSLPDDDQRLGNMAAMGPDWWSANGSFIRQWFVPKAGRLYNQKLLGIYKKSKQLSLERKAAGIAGGRKSAELRQKRAKQSLSFASSLVEPKVNLPTPTPTSLALNASHSAPNGNGVETRRSTWEAYSTSYQETYNAKPVRNAKTNAQIKLFVDRVPHEEAAEIAAFYVKHPGRYYTERGHSLDCLVKDAEKIRTEWATGNVVTGTQALRNEKTAANPFGRWARLDKKGETL
jgi:hypothetical protein